MEYEEVLSNYKNGNYKALSLDDFLFADRLNQERIGVIRVSPCSQAKKKRVREYVRLNYNKDVGTTIWKESQK